MLLTFQVVATLGWRGGPFDHLSTPASSRSFVSQQPEGSRPTPEIVDSSISRRHRAPEKKREREREDESDPPWNHTVSVSSSLSSSQSPPQPPPSFDVSRVRNSRSIDQPVAQLVVVVDPRNEPGLRITTSTGIQEGVHRKAKAASLQQQEAGTS